jgi:acetoin utilization deacetylase AcuC-like enzyme
LSAETETTGRARLLVSTAREMIEHDAGPGHPERPERLRALWRSLEEEPVTSTQWSTPSPASREQCARVHVDAYLDLLLSTRGKRVRFDADTATSPGSVDAAFLAAGAAVEAATAATRRTHELALALVRPPGHHAEAARAMGFCLLNNVAIAAEVAVRELGIERVLIVDWDVHQGNGTQHYFEERSDVLFWSCHRGGDFYPGTGRLTEMGKGAGIGFTVNAPVPAGAGDALSGAVHERVLGPIADAFAPQLVLVSAGFDAHRHDPLGGLGLSDDGFAHLGALVRRIADRHAGGRLALVLEGGYDLVGLVGGLRAALIGALGGRVPAPPPLSAREEELVSALRKAHAAHWPVLA